MNVLCYLHVNPRTILFIHVTGAKYEFARNGSGLVLLDLLGSYDSQKLRGSAALSPEPHSKAILTIGGDRSVYFLVRVT